ncbi:MAG TPA: hypothetical protein VNQ73_15465 [Ilumatobacter sp.]|nr:hypothetical protein [Ilumatobacter sp.]
MFHRRDGTTTLGVQVKARSTETSIADKQQFFAEVRRATFRPRRTLWMLFVLIDKPSATIPQAWFISSADFDMLANRVAGGNKRRITASIKPASQDKWRPFRLDFAELPGRILDVLDDLERLP